MAIQHSFPKDKIKVLLLEGLHPAALDHFREQGYTAIESYKQAFSEDELCEAITKVHFLGIRSKTNVTPKVLESAERLLGIGCFCIGTNQVALEHAAVRGVPVFNAPFSNTRSVAELTLANVVMLARKAAWRSQELHSGVWRKSAEGCFEVRGKTLGIVGYGHIGPQVGLLAEAFGMRVLFYDIARKLPLGNATPVDSLDELLRSSQFVTLHVPGTPQTKRMIARRELEIMPRGSYLINLSRGSVVDIEALAASLRSGHTAGTAIDVFPEEPASNDESFKSALQGIPNVILTPHIGGSTLEAQRNIGIEVASSLVRFSDTGSTSGSVNFPNVDLPLMPGSHRVLNIHRNVPGVLSRINKIVADMGANIMAQSLGTLGDVGYLVMDVDESLSRQVKERIDELDSSIRTRLLF